MGKPVKKNFDEIWDEIFENLKANYSGEIQKEKKLFQFIGKSNDKDFIVKPGKSTIEFSRQIESDFQLGLSSETTALWKKIAVKQDINIGVKDFDARFIIKGEPVDKVIEFLSYETVRDAIRCFEPLKFFKIDKSSVSIIKALRPNEINSASIDFLITRLIDLADCIEKPDEIEEEKLPGEVFQKKIEDIAKGTPEDRIAALEKKLEDLEKRLKYLETK